MRKKTELSRGRLFLDLKNIRIGCVYLRYGKTDAGSRAFDRLSVDAVHGRHPRDDIDEGGTDAAVEPAVTVQVLGPHNKTADEHSPGLALNHLALKGKTNIYTKPSNVKLTNLPARL
jgi:hypothetical protein